MPQLLCPCGCGATINWGEPRTSADLILDIAEAVTKDPDELLIAPGADTDGQLSRVKLALKLYKRKDLCVRALVENWTLQDIVREVY